MRAVRVLNTATGAVLADRAGVASTSESRRTGLLKHASLNAGEGLWIVPSEGVHTVGMKFPIDIVFLSRTRTVLKTCHAVPKWRVALCLRAHSVLELPAGAIAASGTAPGHQLQLTRSD
jgi:uncharacterized membrane protein (UPF0127 family)